MMMDVTRFFTINLYKNKTKYMKIPYANRSKSDKVFTITSSDMSIMTIVRPDIFI